MLAYLDFAVTYTSVHSEARSWSIPSEDPYEEAARQLLEQAPHSPEYVPDPMELEDHVPVYIPEPEHPEDLVPAEEWTPIGRLRLSPPSFISTPGCEVGESSAADTARQPRPTMAHRVDHSLVDNYGEPVFEILRDRATMRTEIEVLRKRRLCLRTRAYGDPVQALARS
ncbi:hypothetical protein Tco_1135160 [Tanacetum coccineum]